MKTVLPFPFQSFQSIFENRYTRDRRFIKSTKTICFHTCSCGMKQHRIDSILLCFRTIRRLSGNQNARKRQTQLCNLGFKSADTLRLEYILQFIGHDILLSILSAISGQAIAASHSSE